MTERSRAAVVAFAIVASVLVATSVPVQGATADDVASITTTDSDFSNARTLTNMSVNGSGSSATVTTKEPTEIAFAGADGDVRTTDGSYNRTLGVSADSVGGAADTDGDGLTEVAISDGGTLKLVDMEGETNNLGASVDRGNVGPVVDFDGDGDLEVLYKAGNDNLHYADLDGTTTDVGVALDATGEVVGMGAADYDNDGDLDVPVITDSTGNVTLVDHNGNTNDWNADTETAGIGGIGDWDGDGNHEVAYQSNGIKLVDKNGNTQQLTSEDGYSIGAMADLDDDNSLELAYATPFSSPRNIKYVDDDGSTVDTGQQGDHVGAIGSIQEPATATYDGQAHTADGVQRAFINFDTLQNASATVVWEGYDGTTWTQLTSNTYTTAGNKTISVGSSYNKYRVNVDITDNAGPTNVTLTDEGVLFDATAPTLDNSSATPSGGTELTTSDVDLQIDVTDSDFATSQGDTVTVTYYTRAPDETTFSKEGTTTVTSNGTATLSTSFTTGGDWEWYATAQDDYGETSLDSDTFQFTVPSTLTLRNETPNHGKIDNAEVQLIFYEDTTDNPTIVNRTVSNGEVDLSGLPVGTEFTVYIDSPDHHTRTVLLDSIYDQDTVYLLSLDESSVEQTFDIQDNTGNFPASETELLVQRAINDSLYDPNGDGFNWTTVAGDDLSASGSFTVDLEPDTRYRLIIENQDGDRRVIGAHTPTGSGTVTLTVSDAVLSFGNRTADYDYNATLTNPGTSNAAIKFRYTDREDQTGDITLRIYEYGNQSNVLLDQTYQGPFGNLTVSQPLTQNQSNKTWVVEATADRGGESVDLRLVVGKGSPLALPVEQFALQVAAIGIIVVVPSMFPGSRDALGAVMASLTAMLFWWWNVLPAEVGASAIAFALMAAYLWKVRKRKGAVQ